MDVGRCFVGELGRSEGLGCEGVGAGVEHTLGEVAGMGCCLDAKVAEHGVRHPAAKELDVVAVDSGAQKGGGASRAQRFGGEQGRVDAGDVFGVCGGVAKGVGDVFRPDVVPFAVVAVVVVVKRSVGRCT